jgi:hypothetical protein
LNFENFRNGFESLGRGSNFHVEQYDIDRVFSKDQKRLIAMIGASEFEFGGECRFDGQVYIVVVVADQDSGQSFFQDHDDEIPPRVWFPDRTVLRALITSSGDPCETKRDFLKHFLG